MRISTSRILSFAIVSLATALISLQTSARSFDSMYSGSPDLVFNVLEQKSATTFAFTVCNQGDVSTGNGKLNVVLQSNEGQIEERTYQNMSLASGNCANLTMYSVYGYTTSNKRKTSITGTIRFEGGRRELKTNNNQVVLGARKIRVDVSDANYAYTHESTSSNNPVYDLWGSSEDQTNWYTSNPTSYSNNYYNSTNITPTHNVGYYNSTGYYDNQGNYINTTNNNGYYSNTSMYTTNNSYYQGYYNPDGTNGDIVPASPTWAVRQGNQNMVFIYTGYNQGSWYSYGPNTRGNYTYYPYNGINQNYEYYDSNNIYHTGNSFQSNQPSYSTFAPGNYNSSCPQWVKTWNTSSQVYQWQCSSNYTLPIGNPDLYLSDLKQNGGRSELIGKVCNQGDTMTSTRQITLRVTNGSYNTSTASFIQLLKGGCSDIIIPFGNLNLNWTGGQYVLYAEIDIYNNVAEVREDNNASYWRLQVQ